jgi:benzoyl-CoA reductase/2-hydroxyglutaryl-CoA dehydratase subunit BcrC/BadD/HgdB
MNDPVKQLTVAEWEERIKSVPDEFKAECCFLRELVPGGVPYLFSPYEYSCKGDLLLRRLKFDSSLASLRLWAFLFSEKDRLFLAKEKGSLIISLMKDLGQTAVITYAFPGQLSFYADELWWAPCFAEESYLLDEAARLGATEELCYVRAALGAMVTGDYFPPPDLCIAGVGGCCDDFSAVMQLIEGLGKDVHWWEMVSRRTRPLFETSESFTETPFGYVEYQTIAVEFLREQFKGIVARMEKLTGTLCTDEMLRGSVSLFNRLRGMVARLREMVYTADRPPLPGLEMYLAEFITIHTCSEPVECFGVVQGLLDTAEKRLKAGESPLKSEKPLRVYWMYPSTDASLITLLEDMGGCIAGTDYFINHSFLPLREDTDPLTAIAENCMDDRLVCSPTERVRRIVEDVKKYRAEGILMSGIFGASHCPWDVSALQELVQEELHIPVLAFDVPYSPGRYNEQVLSRMQGFMDLIRSRREDASVTTCTPFAAADNVESPDAVLDYFKNSMAVEADTVRTLKRQGKGVVGIYCEYTPRDLILAANAYPVCLCGANRRTIPASETVLPSNLCPLIKSSFGYILTGRCPFFMVSDLIVAETTCDGKKKMYELIADRKPQHILELTQKVNEEEAWLHWKSEVGKLKDTLEKTFNIEITDEKLREAIEVMNSERALLREALYLGAEDPPVVTGMELARLRYRISGLDSHHLMLSRFIEMARHRKETGTFVQGAGRRRIIVSGCPMSEGTLKVIELVESAGGIVVAQETCSGLKPLQPVQDYIDGDPLEAIARKHFKIPCSCMTPNHGRLELLKKFSEEFHAHGVIDLVWHACHTYNIESHLVGKYVRDELGLSYLKIETDYSDSDRERLLIRIQTMLEMM